MGFERAQQCVWRQWIEMWQAAEAPDTTHPRNDCFCFEILTADVGDTEHRDVATPHRLEREQCVIDRAKSRARAQHGRDSPSFEHARERFVPGERDEQPAGTLDHERPARIGRREGARTNWIFVERRSQMRRSRRSKSPRFGENTLSRNLTESRDRLAICFAVQPRLHRFPVRGPEHIRECCRKDGLADAGVRAGDEKTLLQGRSADTTCASRSSMAEMSR